MAMRRPKVTVLTPTYNRPNFLRDTVRSVVDQSMEDWELMIINDGGVDVSEVLESFHDDRIKYFNRKQNRGKAACLNLGLEKASGEYIAYIDDDDIWYPNHLAVLSKALDESLDVGAVYSDLYAVNFIHDEKNGKRYPLHKFIQVSRDYNRDFMFYFNHTLHVSLMHRKDLALRVGGYDEDVRVLIDWNITRKLSFYTDFKYIPTLTGEYYMPVGKSDRISQLEREDEERFKHNLRMIKADLPPEPWPKVDRIAVVFPVNEWTESITKIVTELIDTLRYPVRFVLVNNDVGKDESYCRRALGKIGGLKNLLIYTPPRGLSEVDSYRFGAEKAEVDYVYLPSKAVNTGLELRLISGREYINKQQCKGIKWNIKEEQESNFDVLMERDHFLKVSNPVNGGAETLIHVIPPGLPAGLKCDLFMHRARKQHENGNYEFAFQLVREVEAIKDGGAGDQFLIDMYSRICFDLKKYDEAEEKCRILIKRGYGADNWIRLGLILQRKGRFDDAIDAYQKGFQEIGLKESDLDSPVFPIAVHADFGAFTALIGMAECLLEKGDLVQASKVFRKSAKIKANSYRPYLGFGRIFLTTNELKQARQALMTAMKMDGEGPEIYRALGDLYQKEGKTGTAYTNYLEAFHKDRDDCSSLEQIYHLGTSLDKWEEMRQIFEKLLESRPGYVPGMKHLSSIYYELGDHKKARDLVEKAIILEKGKNEPKEIYYHP